MKHKHYDMIVALAENMKLAVFCKGSFDKEWVDIVSEEMPCFIPDNHYFLCLPQHKEACLHWLNGGEVEFEYDSKWHSCSYWSMEWHETSGFICEDNKLRIKPKKEKRWIGVYNHNVTSQHFDSIETAKSFIRRRDEFKNCAPEAWNFIEIEVEV